MARKGFGFQDHVAASFCLDMLLGTDIIAVWCETFDDIVVIREPLRQDAVEFVQVKSDEPGSLWSPAKLCERTKNKGKDVIGSSILERSLARERCLEPCVFRLVTLTDVHADLRPLQRPRSDSRRETPDDSFEKLAAEIQTRADGFVSPRGNAPRSWLERTLWDVPGHAAAVEALNLQRLEEVLERRSTTLALDQRRELYRKLLARVQNAASADWHTNKDAKKLLRSDLLAWLDAAIDRALHPSPRYGTQALDEKMGRANLPPDVIEAARDQRRFYLEKVRERAYLSFSDGVPIVEEVEAYLLGALSELDAGVRPATGPEFHQHCLQVLNELQGQHPGSPPVPRSYLYGCMYDRTNRCVHRFGPAAA